MKKFTKNLKGFPQEIIERIEIEQDLQGNIRDASVLDRNVRANKYIGGFVWMLTGKGFDFWYYVLEERNFALFFKEYPKSK